ncbi:hypothetical protein KI387_013666, partial [Taxus chinensis]
RQELVGIQMPPFHQVTNHVRNLSVANPLDGEFPYINENLEYFTDVEIEEEARQRDVRSNEEIRAQLKEIERLQAKADERTSVEAVAIA